MQSLIQIFLCSLVLSFLFGCKDKSKEKYLSNFPFFKNVEVDQNKSATLNNFTSMTNKNGLEYLVDSVGNLIESRTWINNNKNGFVFLYARSGKIKCIANFKNDTLNGDYFLLDTLTGKIKEYRERLLKDGNNFDNQFIKFTNGKIDVRSSHFIRIEKGNNNQYIFRGFANHNFQYATLFINEGNNDRYSFDIKSNQYEIPSDSTRTIIYNLRNKNAKYLTGYILCFRYVYENEIKEMGFSKDEKLGPMIYFKIKL